MLGHEVDTPHYKGPNRRLRRDGGEPVTNDGLDEALAIHAEEERAYINAMVEDIMSAFPDGVTNHRAYHAGLIKAAEAQEEFWKTAKNELVKASVHGAIRILWIIILLAALGLTVKLAMPDAIAKVILGAIK